MPWEQWSTLPGERVNYPVVPNRTCLKRSSCTNNIPQWDPSVFSNWWSSNVYYSVVCHWSHVNQIDMFCRFLPLTGFVSLPTTMLWWETGKQQGKPVLVAENYFLWMQMPTPCFIAYWQLVGKKKAIVHDNLKLLFLLVSPLCLFFVVIQCAHKQPGNWWRLGKTTGSSRSAGIQGFRYQCIVKGDPRFIWATAMTEILLLSGIGCWGIAVPYGYVSSCVEKETSTPSYTRARQCWVWFPGLGRFGNDLNRIHMCLSKRSTFVHCFLGFDWNAIEASMWVVEEMGVLWKRLGCQTIWTGGWSCGKIPCDSLYLLFLCLGCKELFCQGLARGTRRSRLEIRNQMG